MGNPQVSRRNFVKTIGLGSAIALGTAAASAVRIEAADEIDPPGRARSSHRHEYPDVLPGYMADNIEPREGYIGTTKIIGGLSLFDERDHGFAQTVRRTSQKDWSGKWGETVFKAVQEKNTYVASMSTEEKEDFIWASAMVQATDQIHVNMGPGRFEQIAIASNKLELSPADMTAKIKKVAKWYGAEMVGIAEINESMRPFVYKIGRTQGTYRGGWNGYEDTGRDIPWPYPYKYCIVCGNFEDLQTTKGNVGGLNNIAVATECSDDDIYPTYLETVIRQLGYDAKAQPFSNKDIMEGPFAVAAGIGELGRSGLVVTPWGAHVRLYEVLTNMPLIPDKPIDFGLQNMCRVCRKCADNCPSGAITDAVEPTEVMTTTSTVRWEWDPYKCMAYRITYGCSTCAAVCVYSKPNSALHNAGRFLAKQELVQPVLRGIDDLFYGKNPKPRQLSAWAPWRI
ncbi:reductive dehalogenase [Dehalogenimonas sp. WBC-2]|nr:reductive dehalogenase [Dehalogenimonas sp. WBC-2]